ncbi:MFS transporter [Alcanivorax sp.]|uniref:MFS transporter n=1 Tax=Alcanivorax sp. TaxID=1872427 RepID=UPI0025C2179E|nr:MFS transporter [Alcanivorax sp.]
MLPLIVPIGAVLLGVALLLLGSGLLNTLLAVRGSLEGYSDSSLGLIMSGYFLGYFSGTFAALPLIRRVGHIRAFAMCAALAACSALLHVMFVEPWVWMALRVMNGFVLVILYTVVESWLNGQTPAEQRGRVFAVYMAINLGALAAAQQLLRLESAMSFMLFAIAAMLISVSLVPVTWTRFAQPPVETVSRLRFKALYKAAPVSVAGALLSGLAMGAFWGLGPVYASRVGLDSASVATFMSVAILGGALFQYPLGRYSDTHDRRTVLAVICVAAAIAAVLVWLSSGTPSLLYMAIGIYGGLAFCAYPVALAHLIDRLDADKILSGGSSALFLHGVGAAIGPALAGQLMELLGPRSLPFYFVIMQVALALYTFMRLHVVREDLSDHSTHFVPMVRTSQVALEMMPEDEVEPGSEDDAHDSGTSQSEQPPDKPSS